MWRSWPRSGSITQRAIRPPPRRSSPGSTPRPSARARPCWPQDPDPGAQARHRQPIADGPHLRDMGHHRSRNGGPFGTGVLYPARHADAPGAAGGGTVAKGWRCGRELARRLSQTRPAAALSAPDDSKRRISHADLLIPAHPRAIIRNGRPRRSTGEPEIIIGVEQRTRPARCNKAMAFKPAGQTCLPPCKGRSPDGLPERANDARHTLMVEDEPGVADFVRRGLRAEGWIIDHVTGAEDALIRLRDEPCDVLLLERMLF